jgi:hypothetical protein
MTTTVLKNTGIKNLLEVSAGNFEVLRRMTEEFRQRVEEPVRRPQRSSRKLEFVLKSSEGTYTTSVSVDFSPCGKRLTITNSQI